uniref:Ig-like domain-containing protein n=1 Tax=Cynoglossus semilaevis TaxID=244447 RepID=A0A3P8W9E9_CYNSE
MFYSLVVCTVPLLCCAGTGTVHLQYCVRQTPEVLVQRGGSAHMHCSQNRHGSLVHMDWFQQPSGSALTMVAQTVPYNSPVFASTGGKGKYSAHKKSPWNGSFTVNRVEQSDAGVYLCVVCCHSDAESFSFGDGTKVTVLESQRPIRPPTVTVLPPSVKECQDRKDGRNKKTLVCVASEFYPDHVAVSWLLDGEDVTGGVVTDSAALWRGEHYYITSRLRVPLTQWFTPGRNFTCLVSFFDGHQTVYRSNWVTGVEGTACTHSEKLSRQGETSAGSSSGLTSPGKTRRKKPAKKNGRMFVFSSPYPGVGLGYF